MIGKYQQIENHGDMIDCQTCTQNSVRICFIVSKVHIVSKSFWAMPLDWLDSLVGLSGCLERGRKIRVAEDCAGVGPCGFIMKELEAKHGIASTMLWSCDTDATCRSMIERHSVCQHLLADVNLRVFGKHSMVSKDVAGKVVSFDRYKDPLDIYTAGVSCRPFSSKGGQTGWKHPEAKTLFQAIKTIQVLRPRIALLENVCGIVGKRWLPGLQKLLAAVSSHTYQCFKVNSMDFGLPQHRGRIYLLLLDKSCFPDLSQCFGHVAAFLEKARLLFGPPPAITSFLENQGLPIKANTTPVKTANRCSCSVRTKCPLHPCRCKRCSYGQQPGLSCKWRVATRNMRQSPRHRRACREFLGKWQQLLKQKCLKKPPGFFELSRAKGLNADGLIKSPRVRLMLETLSGKMHLLGDACVIDTSQSISRATFREDGVAPAVTCSSNLLVPCKAAYLTGRQCLAIQGINPMTWNVEGIPEEKLLKLAGNGMSLTVLASFLIAGLELLSKHPL